MIMQGCNINLIRVYVKYCLSNSISYLFHFFAWQKHEGSFHALSNLQYMLNNFVQVNARSLMLKLKLLDSNWKYSFFLDTQPYE